MTESQDLTKLSTTFLMLTRGGAVAQLVKCWVWHTAVVGSIPQHDKGRFSQSAFSVDSYSVCTASCVQSHASTYNTIQLYCQVSIQLH